MQDIKAVLREVFFAIIPITIVVVLLQFTLIGMPAETFMRFLVGAAFVFSGFFLFLLGVETGLLPLGEQIGAVLPKTGKAWVVVLFGFLLGFVVTLAEPDLRVLATQADYVSDGGIARNMLVFAVALGVAVFVGLAMLRIILNIPMNYMLAVSYALVLILALFTPERFVPLSFDSGGVTTGPMTVPFILALGVGVASVLRGKTASSDGFGLVALASIGPILAMMLLGVMYR